MSLPRSTYLDAAGFEMHVTEWGERDRPAIVMWHGLARTGRDFDELASALSDRYFVLCPDTLGRGLSSWAEDKADHYAFRTYCAMALDMLAHYGIETLRWVGTSMGGLIGITLAAGALKDRMTHLVINDVGPDIPAEGAQRIVDYVGNPPVFDTVFELEQWLRANYVHFGVNSDAFWRRMADTSMRRTDGGRVTVHYDPAIVSQFRENKADLDVWETYDAVKARALLIRGEASDVLSPKVAESMTRRGPRPRLETVAGCGHAPTLASSDQIALVREFVGE